MDSPFLATIREPLLALRLFDCCISSVKKYRLGTSKCHDHDILTLHQPIRLQHFERGNENIILKCSKSLIIMTRLCNCRFKSPASIRELPSWLRPYINQCDSFGVGLRDIMKFFKTVESIVRMIKNRTFSF